MQPISAIGTPALPSPVNGPAGSGNTAPAPAVPFKDLLAEALSRSPGAAPSTMGKTTLDKAQAALSAAAQLRDAVLGAYNEIKDLRI
jgi:hypothetical protein